MLDDGTSMITVTEQREWVGDRLDAAVAATGQLAGWRWTGGATEPYWAAAPNEERAKVLESLFPASCDGSTSRVELSLTNVGLSDPLDSADRVRAFWTSEGWEITDVGQPEEERPHFRGGRADGAMVAAQATAKGVVLRAYSPCSSHETVTNWGELLEDGGNPFTEELERREEDPASRS